MDPKSVPSKIIASAPVGPLSQYIEPYVAFVNELGFAPRSVYEQIRVIVMFSRSLQRSGCEIRDLDESVTEHFLYNELRGRWPHVNAAATLRRLLALLRRIGAIPPGKPAPPRSHAQQLADDYRRFLLKERALSPETANGWVRFIDEFLSEQFGASMLRLSELCAADVTAFVQRHAHRHKPSHARRLVTAMRSFLRYLRYKGLIEINLDTAVPRVARWSLSNLPKHLPAVQVQRVLDSCNLETSTGRRDYAILLLLARLGLRAGEVARLELEDIDWLTR
jgi:integrase/recombinase XerD